jgi:cellulose synthase/poly-beta-1,6-N-acetylglucosamine synthase-like glycosyltransferase
MCGAGEIKYNARGFGLHRVFCMIDSHRTGEDLGRFRLQFLSKQAAMTGVHGSFFVVPAKLESDIQFDFGQRGSITEDIYFAFRLRELSVPYSWVHGHVREQSPPDLRNFLRQRARWIHGLLNMCGDRRFSLLHRLTLLVYLAMLRTTIVAGFALTLLALIYPLSPIISVLWQLSMLVVGTNVLVGLLRNIQDEEAGGGVTNAVTIAAGVCLVPVICLLETLAVARGILFRENEFFVVAKT